MKPHGLARWSQEDVALEQEYADISKQWQQSTEAESLPTVAPQLGKHIKRLARYQHPQDLSRNWVFGNLPKLILVLLLFFSIALAYLLSVADVQAAPSALRGVTDGASVSLHSHKRSDFGSQ